MRKARGNKKKKREKIDGKSVASPSPEWRSTVTMTLVPKTYKYVYFKRVICLYMKDKYRD